MDRRAFLCSTAGMSALTLLPIAPAFAEWRPRRPINVILPYKAGGGTDAFGRALSAAAKGIVPVPIVIVNKPGSGGITGASTAKSARPDGSTVLLTSAGSLILTSMLRNTNVDPFEDFVAIAQVGNLKGALAVPADSPFRSVADLVESAKAAPGKLRWAHNGRGTTFQVIGQSFLEVNGLEVGDVPFKGGAALRAALIGEQVDFGFIGVQQGLGFEKQMRTLALNAPERDRIQPDIPTFKELGFDWVDVSTPVAMFAPKGTDPEIIAGMEAYVEDATANPKFAELLEAKGVYPDYLGTADTRARLLQIRDAVAPVVAKLKSGS